MVTNPGKAVSIVSINWPASIGINRYVVERDLPIDEDTPRHGHVEGM